MDLRDPTGNGKAESRPVAIGNLSSSFLNAEEPLKDKGLRFGRNPDAGVGNADSIF